MQLRINACAEVQQTAGSESLGSLNVRLRITAVSVWADSSQVKLVALQCKKPLLVCVSVAQLSEEVPWCCFKHLEGQRAFVGSFVGAGSWSRGEPSQEILWILDKSECNHWALSFISLSKWKCFRFICGDRPDNQRCVIAALPRGLKSLFRFASNICICVSGLHWHASCTLVAVSAR